MSLGHPTRRALLLGGAGALGLGLAGCGLGTSGGFVPTGRVAGPIGDVDLSGLTLAVGSKNFTEQIVLGKLAVILFRSAGADAQDLTNIPGSSSARQAMQSFAAKVAEGGITPTVAAQELLQGLRD